MLSFSKLPTRRLQEVKGKTLMRWHIKIIHINVNKSFRSSSQNKFSTSSHSTGLSVRSFLSQPWTYILMLRNTC